MSKLIGDRLEAEGAVPGDEENFDVFAARTRLPIWLWAEGREACAHVFTELWCCARDGYEHQPSALQRQALYWSLQHWHEEGSDRLDKDLEPLKGERLEEELATIEQLMGHGLGNTRDFIHLDSYVNDLLQGEEPPDVRALPWHDLLDLIPPDVRVRVQDALKKREAGST